MELLALLSHFATFKALAKAYEIPDDADDHSKIWGLRYNDERERIISWCRGHGLFQNDMALINPKLVNDEALRANIGSKIMNVIKRIEKVEERVIKDSPVKSQKRPMFGRPGWRTGKTDIHTNSDNSNFLPAPPDQKADDLQWPKSAGMRLGGSTDWLGVEGPMLRELLHVEPIRKDFINYPWDLLKNPENAFELKQLEQSLNEIKWHEVAVSAGIRRISIEELSISTDRNRSTQEEIAMSYDLLQTLPFQAADYLDGPEDIMHLTYNGERIYVEWHCFGSREEAEIISPSCIFLARKLHLARQRPEYGSLPFKGYIEPNESRLKFGYAFNIPKNLEMEAVSLSKLLQDFQNFEEPGMKRLHISENQNFHPSNPFAHIEDGPPPSYYAAASLDTRPKSLGTRYKMARALAKALSLLIASRWLHKGIRSKRIIFLPIVDSEGQLTGRYDYDQPYLQGFIFAKEYHPAVNIFQETHIGIEETVYQHPRYRMMLAGSPRWNRYLDNEKRLSNLDKLDSGYSHLAPSRDGYNAAFDIYSLGIVLLEIGLWKTAESLGIMREDRIDWNRVKWCLDELEIYLGETYRKVVELCINWEVETEPDSKSNLLKRFTNRVLYPLESIASV